MTRPSVAEVPIRLIGLAVVLALSISAPFDIEAQQPSRVWRIGVLSPFSPSPGSHSTFEALAQGLRELGWVDGQNIAIEYRGTEGDLTRLPDLAAELVRLKVDVIVAPTTAAALAAKNATRSMPIVMVYIADPVGAGLVASLARPGGNITGLSWGGRVPLDVEINDAASGRIIHWCDPPAAAATAGS
ncbi:MAG: hypothetical protein DMD87_30600 [Candidatus Rokuibacteriota bacterium]|nr:MAG: hypothetical protein DMD87_30600 [Candidatus Rokubacteria bacterium]